MREVHRRHMNNQDSKIKVDRTAIADEVHALYKETQKNPQQLASSVGDEDGSNIHTSMRQPSCSCISETHADSSHKQKIPQKVEIRSLSHDQLTYELTSMGEPAFRVKQIEAWLWQKNARSFDDMTNLSKKLRARLKEKFALYSPALVSKQVSQDGSRKYLLRFQDGVMAECVGMPTKNKLAICVSTQAGCAIGCVFCATGKAGLTRSLTGYEIYEQALFIQDDFQMRVASAVLMGQGEPLTNYDASIFALKMMNSADGLGVGARHLTISTCGILPNIIKFSHEKEQFTLAVSLHSAVQSTRDYLMPGVKRFNLQHLHDTMNLYVEATGRRPTYEYALIKGVNDTDEELAALCDFCAGTLAHVNLIQLNKIDDSPFLPTSEKRAEHFVKTLKRFGIEATIRHSRGADIDAACGQLKQKVVGKKRV